MSEKKLTNVQAAALALGLLADASGKLEAALLNYAEARSEARKYMGLMGFDEEPAPPTPPPVTPTPINEAASLHQAARRVARASLSAREKAGKQPKAA